MSYALVKSRYKYNDACIRTFIAIHVVRAYYMCMVQFRLFLINFFIQYSSNEYTTYTDRVLRVRKQPSTEYEYGYSFAFSFEYEYEYKKQKPSTSTSTSTTRYSENTRFVLASTSTR